MLYECEAQQIIRLELPRNKASTVSCKGRLVWERCFTVNLPENNRLRVGGHTQHTQEASEVSQGTQIEEGMSTKE